MDAVLCRKKKKSTGLQTIKNDSGDAFSSITTNEDLNNEATLRIESMAECLDGDVEDSLSLYLQSPGFHNELPSLLQSREGNSGTERGSETQGPVGTRPVGLLISTLNTSSSSTSPQDDVLPSSLFAFLLSMSNDVYVIVPDTSACDSLSALSVICCELSSPGQ